MANGDINHPRFPSRLRLSGEGLVLREWSDDDLPAMVELFEDPDVACWTPLASPFDAPAARGYLSRARQKRVDDLSIQLAITTDGQLPLGEILLFRQDANDRTASLGYTVGAAHRGKRLGSRALKVMTEYAHHTADMPRVTLSIAAENGASVAVARAAGYLLTNEPQVSKVNKGRPLTMQLWAHDHPAR
ncbi:GNAT family N-acetyltransferase [Streptomyces sp. E11-3]|uniref:GNAT family N-acetyltransferase n=1 Tax=Streptomyces sp. E11-3 TaxID=3110112 RepID=UPI0039801E05